MADFGGFLPIATVSFESVAALRDSQQSAMKGHSPVSSTGRSDVGSAQQTAIRFSQLTVAFSAITWIIVQRFGSAPSTATGCQASSFP
jgi:hypothetical protein